MRMRKMYRSRMSGGSQKADFQRVRQPHTLPRMGDPLRLETAQFFGIIELIPAVQPLLDRIQRLRLPCDVFC